MKFIFSVLCLVACSSCASRDASTNLDETHRDALDKAFQVAGEEADRIASLDPAPFKIEMTEDEDYRIYSRRGLIIMKQSKKLPAVHRLMGPDGMFGHVVTGKHNSPRIAFLADQKLGSDIVFLTKDLLMITTYDVKLGYVEGYLATKDWITPIDEKTYLRMLASTGGIKKFFDEIFKDLTKPPATETDEETK